MSSRIRTLNLKPRAIVYGCLANFGANIVIGVAITVFALSRNVALDDLESTLQMTGYQVVGLVLGLLAMVLGGYVAARKSPGAELTNAIAVGVVMALLGILIQVIFRIPLDLWGSLGFVTMIPAAAAGGLVRVSQLERSTATG